MCIVDIECYMQRFRGVGEVEHDVPGPYMRIFGHFGLKTAHMQVPIEIQ